MAQRLRMAERYGKESLDEHQAMQSLIRELQNIGPDDKAFDAKFTELIRIQELKEHLPAS